MKWALTPIRQVTKAPILDNWQETILQEEEIDLRDARLGVGVILGEYSGDLVDVDLDSKWVCTVAGEFLPRSTCIFGRKSKPKSHYFYTSMDEVTYQEFVDPIQGGTLLELRGKGRQTLIPPSIHISGEVISYTSFNQPEENNLDLLRLSCTKLATLSLLVHNWPELGSRHETYLALSGALLLGGWTLDDVREVIVSVTNFIETAESEYKVRIVEDTFDTINRGDHPTNWRKLGDLLGEKIALTIKRWLSSTQKVYKSSGKIALDATIDIEHLMWQSWDVLKNSNTPPVIFQQGGALVRIEELDSQKILIPVNDVRLHNLLTSRIEFYKQVSHGRMVVQPPGNLTIKILADTNLPGKKDWVPVIDRIVDHPMITPDGEILLTEGYHPEWKTYITKSWSINLNTISLEEAKAVLEDVLVDFPLSTDTHKAHAIALLLQPFVRLLIPGNTPMYVFTAPSPGSGKTLLGKVLLFPALGRVATPEPCPKDDSEMRKYLTSKLLRDHQVVFFDNTTDIPDLPSLSAALTSTGFESRILGTSTSVVVRSPDIWVATGNNPTIDRDMKRRFVPIRIIPGVEDPSRRTGFTHPDILKYVQENRERVVIAICKIAIEGIRSKQVGPTIGSFEDWSRVLGGILTGTGYKGFLQKTDDEATGIEPNKDFIRDWWHRFGEEPVFLQDLIPIIGLTFPSSRGVWTPRELAIKLEEVRDSVASGVRVMYLGKYLELDRWVLKTTGLEPVLERDPSSVEKRLSKGEPTIRIGSLQMN